MTIRSGMTHLVQVMRGMCEVGTGDYSIGTANYWDNDQIQLVLDRHRRDIVHEELTSLVDWSGGTVNYFEYVSRFKNYEQTTGGTSIFYVEHRTGDDVASGNYTVDYFRGRVTFSADTGGSTLYLTGRSYDLDGAAADIWRQKAGHAASMYDFSTDNHRFNRSQYMKHCMQMAAHYDSRAGVGVGIVTRSDVDASALK